MKKPASLLLLIILTTLALSCSKEDDGNCDQPAAASDNFLEDLQTGDKLQYTLWTVENYFSESESQFQYTGDTLELEVLEISPSGILISEKITPGSNMMSSTETYYWNKDSVFLSRWNIAGDSLLVTSDQTYYFSHLIKIPRLKFSDFSEPEVAITDYRSDYNSAEMDVQLFTTNYTLFGHLYDTLSVYINNSAMALDGPGYTNVYGRSKGIVRGRIYSGETGWGQGWDRIW
jgi:hypothetical protein